MVHFYNCKKIIIVKNYKSFFFTIVIVKNLQKVLFLQRKCNFIQWLLENGYALIVIAV